MMVRTATPRRWLWAALGLCTGCSDYDIQRQPAEDVFWQSERASIDLLLLVDDSPSMLEEAAQVDRAVTGLLEGLVLVDADLQVLVATTTPLPPSPVVRVDSMEAIDHVRALLPTDPSGDRTEAGLARVLSTLPELPVRAGGMRHAVILSDEDDHGVESPEAAAAAIMGEDAVLSAVVGDLPAGCVSGVAAADPAPRYRSAALSTGGSVASICAGEVGDVLASLGHGLVGLQTHFPLSSLPVPESIEVTVNGGTPERRARHGWTWKSGENAVLFDGLAVPPPGASVVVRYTVATPVAAEGRSALPAGAVAGADSGAL